MKAKTPQEKAHFIVERDLAILTGDELYAKYGHAGSAAANGFEEIVGRPVSEVAPLHNPFYHYLLAVYFDKADGKKLLYPPRHRDELANVILEMVLGKTDSYDGVLVGWPRRALKSTFMVAACDWAAKRHKIIDGMDVVQFYVHNSDREAAKRVSLIKNKNRHHRYIKRYFPEFRIPASEWGTKSEFNWPCKSVDSSVSESSITAFSLASKKAGKGAHYRWLDDCEDEDSRDSKVRRDESGYQYDQLRALAAPAFSREMFCNTPYHIHGLTSKLRDAKRDDETPRYKIVWTSALDDNDKPTFPTIPRLTVAGLARERANEIARTGNDIFWTLQYLLDTRLTGTMTFEWEWFQKLSRREFDERWMKKPNFRCIFVDSAWKGTENQTKGDDTAIGVVIIFKVGKRMDWVFADLSVSREWASDEGASEICRLGKKWTTPYIAPEMSGEKTFVGTMRQAGKIHLYFPHIINLGGFSKKHKQDRIAQMAGHARMGFVYYLEDLPNFEKLRDQVIDHPQLEHEDILDMFANAWAEEILTKWCPVDWGYEPIREDPPEPVYLTRYTGLVAVH